MMDWQTIESSCDGMVCVTALPKSLSLKAVLAELCLPSSHRRSRHDGKDEPEYRGSMEWRHYRGEPEDGVRPLVITVDVGCWCSHDCCGHLCSLYYTIHHYSYAWVIRCSKGYNL